MEDTPVGIDICVERVPGAFSLNTIEEEALRLRRRRYTEDLRRALLPLARVPACQCRPWRWNIVPVRHSSPLRIMKRSAKLRTVVAASFSAGLPPGAEKRPGTGVRPGRKTSARESAAPLPLLSK